MLYSGICLKPYTFVYLHLFFISEFCALEEMGQKTFNVGSLQSFLKGFLKLRDVANFTQCPLWSFSHLLCFHGTASAQKLFSLPSLFSLTLLLLTDSAFPGMRDSQTCSDTHMHWLITCRKSCCLFRSVPVFHITFILHVLFFEQVWMKCLNYCIYTLYFCTHKG